MRGLSTDSETPHPSAFGSHLLPQGEKEGSQTYPGLMSGVLPSAIS